MARRQPRLGAIPGVSLDLTGTDEQGNPWDFNLRGQREKAENIIDEQQPLLLIGTPMCTAFSNIQYLNKAKRDPEVVRRELAKACVHLNWCCHLYTKQMDRGAYFVHEHRAGATSWRETKVMELLQRQGVKRIVADQCQFARRRTLAIRSRSPPDSCPMRWCCWRSSTGDALGDGACAPDPKEAHIRSVLAKRRSVQPSSRTNYASPYCEASSASLSTTDA